jgi:hypothetical protein
MSVVCLKVLSFHTFMSNRKSTKNHKSSPVLVPPGVINVTWTTNHEGFPKPDQQKVVIDKF